MESLTFERALAIGAFPPMEVSYQPSHVAEYVRITGDDNAAYERVVPPAFAAIFARKAYLQDHVMPPGGVMLGQSITWYRPALLQAPLTVHARIVSSSESPDGRRAITFWSVARQHGEKVAGVLSRIGWPP